MNTEPRPNEYEVIVLGGGKGGKTLAVYLGKKGIKTALIERSEEMIGGSCINVACIPTKTLIASARAAAMVRRAGDFGIRTGDVAVDWPAVRRRAEQVVSAMRAMNHKNFTSSPALDFIVGTGRFLSPQTIEVRASNGQIRQLTAKKIFINTGTRPARPAVPGLAAIDALNSETIQRLDALPSHLIVIGGGYVGVEFAQMFRRLGSEVTVVERGPQLIKREDPDIAEALTQILRGDGIDIRLGAAIDQVKKAPHGVTVVLNVNGEKLKITGSHVLAALGRSPNTGELDLSAAGVETDERGFIRVNEQLETTCPNIWALGDVNGGPQFTHASYDDYRIVKANVFETGRRPRTTADRLVPFTLFTEPELARVGITEKEARERGLHIRTVTFPAGSIPRAKTTGETHGLIKAVLDAASGQILGCAILCAGAGEMLGTVQMTMLAGLPVTALRDAVLSHPTMVESFNMMFPA